ncbi:hypothetical protein [Kribbella sp. NPDC048915]|uniref:hypothetical protein n=1 Tax=Kribbella sp. NPDC048915 TaxID=3155148 RepID=UPI0033F02274
MRREDVRPLLLQAADPIPEPELADAAWAAGRVVRRRRRRTVAIGVVAVLALAVVASLLIEWGSSSGGDNITPPTNPPGYVEPVGKINGIDYWVAPPPGSERFLDRLRTPLGDRLDLPEKVRRLEEHPVENVAAVTLVSDGERYTPLILDSDGTWVRADVALGPVGGTAPFSAGSIAPDGRVVAFPQRGGVVTVNTLSAQVSRFPLPDGDYSSVSWVADGRRVLVSGPNAAYQVLVGEGNQDERAVVQVSAPGDPNEATSPYSLQTGSVMRYQFNGRWIEDTPLTLPIRSWQGQTFASLFGAARIFVAEDLPQVPTRVSQPQVLAAMATLRTVPSRLLVLGEPQDNPPAREGAGDVPFVREVGCCVVLGWYDDSNVLFRVHGWVLAWNLDSGRVRRVTELRVDQVALGPGLRP